MNDYDDIVDCLNPKSQTPWPWSNMPGGSWLAVPATVLAEQGSAWRGKVSLGRVKQEPVTDVEVSVAWQASLLLLLLWR